MSKKVINMIEAIYLWIATGVLSAILSSILVVRPSRDLAKDYFLDDAERFIDDEDVLYMFRYQGTFLHYAVHSVISILSGPIIGFLTTLSKDAAIRGYYI